MVFIEGIWEKIDSAIMETELETDFSPTDPQ